MSIIGLDLGNTSFRAVEIERKKGELYLLKTAAYENTKLSFDSEAKEDVDAYAYALREFISDAGFTTPNVSVGLDERYIYMRIIKLPQMSDKDLKNAVNFEAEQYIPLPLNEVNVSFQRLDVDYNDKAKVNIQVVAARKAILERYIQVLKKSRLVPKSIEPETLALSRAIGDSTENPAASLILDMGYSRTIIIISYGGYVRFTRNIPIGGDVLTRALKQTLNLDQNQAEEYKKTYGMERAQVDGKVYDVLKPHIDSIISEVQRASIFFTKQQPNASIKRVILSGGTAQMPGLLLYLASNIDFEVETASPFKNFQLSPKVAQQDPKLMDHSPVYSTAIGLALKDL
jgi:type IV pilus assembly protein PilM